MLEKKIEKMFSTCILEKGGFSIKLFSPWFTGLPDRLGMFRGRIFFVELKAPSGRLSLRQKIVHKLLRKHGCQVDVLWTVEQVKKFIDDL